MLHLESRLDSPSLDHLKNSIVEDSIPTGLDFVIELTDNTSTMMYVDSDARSTLSYK
jgi:hypothetical protein